MSGVLDLWGIAQTRQILKWLISWKPDMVKIVQQELDDLVNDLTMSLKNLHNVVCDVTGIPAQKLSQKTFSEKYDYFVNFYLGHENISSARTHCGNVERDVKRIRFKLEKAGFTDVGEWSSVDEYIRVIQDSDELLLCSYDRSLDYLKTQLDIVKAHLNKEVASQSFCKSAISQIG